MGARTPAAQQLGCIYDAHIKKGQTEPLLQLTHEVGYYRGVEIRRQKVAFSLAPWDSGCGLAPETSLPLHPMHGVVFLLFFQTVARRDVWVTAERGTGQDSQGTKSHSSVQYQKKWASPGWGTPGSAPWR